MIGRPPIKKRTRYDRDNYALSYRFFILPKFKTMKKSTLVFLAIFVFLLYASIAVAQNFGVMYALPIGTVFLLWSIFGVFIFDLHETNAKK